MNPIRIRKSFAWFACCLSIAAAQITASPGFALAQPLQGGPIQLPRTGQTTCYSITGTLIDCLTTGQDGEYQKGAAWPNPRFISDVDECLTDTLTGLMWDRDANRPNIGKTWSEALAYVAGINSGGGLCGFHDWRLPNVNEIQTLVNSEPGNNDGWLASQGFVHVSKDGYWTSTTHTARDYKSMAFYILMRQRYIQTDAKSNYRLTWPVRTDPTVTPISQPARTGQILCYSSSGAQVACAGTGQDGDTQAGAVPPASRFSAGSGAAAECVSDRFTTLMWSKDANLGHGVVTWQQAMDLVKTINAGTGLCGFRDWRLPNRVELSSLLDYSQYSNVLPKPNPFTNVFPDSYWTSTASTYQYGVDAAWVVRVFNGEIYTGAKTITSGSQAFWPVRDDTGTPPPGSAIYLPVVLH
jgi:hypothetical protein